MVWQWNLTTRVKIPRERTFQFIRPDVSGGYQKCRKIPELVVFGLLESYRRTAGPGEMSYRTALKLSVYARSSALLFRNKTIRRHILYFS